jgi:tRNA pseudouridine-54 N-methylase
VEVSILIGSNDNLKSITFPGASLKRVSPDERSIAFFLLKAHSVLDKMHENSERTMDNGILLHRLALKELFNRWLVKECFIAAEEFNTNSEYNEVSEAGIFLYDLTKCLDLGKYNTKPLPRPSHPERFILEINLHCDNRL